MPILRSDNLFIAAPKPVDNRYDNNGQGYIDVAAVNAAIIQSYRYIGLTVNIQGVEYWYRDGTGDGDLIAKDYSSTITHVVDDVNNGILVGGQVAGGVSITGNSSDANADFTIIAQGTGTLKAGGNHTANIGEADDLITFAYAEANYASGTVSGSNTQVQFNDNGSFGASANLTFSSDTLSVNGTDVGGSLIQFAGTGTKNVFSSNLSSTLSIGVGTNGANSAEGAYISIQGDPAGGVLNLVAGDSGSVLLTGGRLQTSGYSPSISNSTDLATTGFVDTYMKSFASVAPDVNDIFLIRDNSNSNNFRYSTIQSIIDLVNGGLTLNVLGTPAANQVTFWSSSNEITGSDDFTWNGSLFSINGDLISTSVTSSFDTSGLGSYSIQGLTVINDQREAILTNLTVDNIQVDGNTILTSSGDLFLNPSGSNVDFSGKAISNVTIDASLITSGVLDNARVQESNVTQHQAALSITESQISDLGATITLNADTDVSSNAWVLDEDDLVSNSNTKVPTQQSVRAYVDGAVASNVNYRGSYDAATNTPDLDTSPSGISTGDMYTVTVAGVFFTANLEVGDVLISEVDNPTVEADWTIVQKNLDASSVKALYEANTVFNFDNIQIDGNTISTTDLDGNLTLAPNGSGSVEVTGNSTFSNDVTLSDGKLTGTRSDAPTSGTSEMFDFTQSNTGNVADYVFGRFTTGSGGNLAFRVSNLNLAEPQWQMNLGSTEAFSIAQGATDRFLIDASGNATFSENVSVGGLTNSDYSGNAGNQLLVGSSTANQGITIRSNTLGLINFADGTTSSQTYAGRVIYDHSTDELKLSAGGVTTGDAQFVLSASSATFSGNIIGGGGTTNSTTIGNAPLQIYDGTSTGAQNYIIEIGRTDQAVSGGLYKGTIGGANGIGLGTLTAHDLELSANGSVGLTVKSGSGNVDFSGSLTASSNGHSFGSSTFTRSGSIPLTVNRTSTSGVLFSGQYAGAAAVYLRGSGTEGGMYTPSGLSLMLGSNGNTNDLTIDTSGNAAFTGNVTATDFTSTSDERLKENFISYGSVLDRVIQTKGLFSHFKWKESGVADVGYSAQKIQKIFPEVVKENNNLSISYAKMSGIALEAICELKEQIETLKIELKELRNKG